MKHWACDAFQDTPADFTTPQTGEVKPLDRPATLLVNWRCHWSPVRWQCGCGIGAQLTGVGAFITFGVGRSRREPREPRRVSDHRAEKTLPPDFLRLKVRRKVQVFLNSTITAWRSNGTSPKAGSQAIGAHGIYSDSSITIAADQFTAVAVAHPTRAVLSAGRSLGTPPLSSSARMFSIWLS